MGLKKSLSFASFNPDTLILHKVELALLANFIHRDLLREQCDTHFSFPNLLGVHQFIATITESNYPFLQPYRYHISK